MKFKHISLGVPIYASDFGDFFIPVQKFSDQSCSGICYTLSDVEMFYVIYSDESNGDSNEECGAFWPATKNDFTKVSNRLTDENIYHDIIERIFNYKPA